MYMRLLQLNFTCPSINKLLYKQNKYPVSKGNEIVLAWGRLHVSDNPCFPETLLLNLLGIVSELSPRFRLRLLSIGVAAVETSARPYTSFDSLKTPTPIFVNKTKKLLFPCSLRFLYHNCSLLLWFDVMLPRVKAVF